MKRTLKFVCSVILIVAFVVTSLGFSAISATSIKLNHSVATLVEGSNYTIKAVVSPANTTNKAVSFTSSKAGVCTVDSNGKITAVQAGTAVVTAKTSNGKSTTCTITVVKAPKSGPSWKWDTSSFELTWYVGFNWASKEWKPDSVLFDKEVARRTGANKITLIYPSEGQDKLVAMMASKNMPDMITMETYDPMYKMLQNDDVCYPLFDLIDKYAPTMRQIIPDSMSSFHVADNGKWYTINAAMTCPEDIWPAYSLFTDTTVAAREDIMTQLNISKTDFKTQDGMIKTLKKVKDAKLKTEAGFDILPIYLQSSVGNLRSTLIGLAELFGYSAESKTGKYVFPEKNAKYKEMAKFINRLYREGLLTKQNILAQPKEVNTTSARGQVFCMFGNLGAYMDSYYGYLQPNGNKTRYVAVEPTRSLDAGKVYAGVSMLGDWLGVFITKAAKKPDRVIRLFEFLYSEEGQDLHCNGVEGITYQVRADGVWEATPGYAAEYQANRAATNLKYGLNSLYGFRNEVVRFKKTYDPKKLKTPEDDFWMLRSQYMSVYVNDAINGIAPKAGTRESSQNAKILIYAEEQISKIITAINPTQFEKLYSDMIKKINELGVYNVEKAMNAIFQKNKEKLGISFMYPGNKN